MVAQLTRQELDELAARIGTLDDAGAGVREQLKDQVMLYGYKSFHLRGNLYDFFYKHGKLTVTRHEPEPNQAA